MHLYARFPRESEFHLTTRKQKLVSNAALAQLFERMGLGGALLRDERAIRSLAAARCRGGGRPPPPNPHSEGGTARPDGGLAWLGMGSGFGSYPLSKSSSKP